MTLFLLLSAVILLLLLNGLQFRRNREKDRQLQYITKKINSIITQGTSEKLLVVTGDKQLQALLAAINQLLSEKQSTAVNFQQTELAMKKMLVNISHDLKTPLTVVLGYLEAILTEQQPHPQVTDARLNKVQQKVKELLELMNKFFDLARLESEDKLPVLAKVNISEICKKNILFFYDVIQTEGLEAVIEIPDLPVYTYSEEESLDRILNNLLSNAIRYGKEGKVVGLKLHHDEHNVYIEVWDKGKGIHEKHADKVFERMYTLEDSRNKLYVGSGLGLTITKRLVEKLNGTIELVSKPYEKTTFRLKFKKLAY
ncbi:Signal transduction histidine kinase [Evansella caseinilytica]|uniref:histidine kinase n=1 Tax=Evansella caseinilytica TaxID=1503961 RepID=A0A1H3Q9M3_9BACI|nr:sensor histidine kinase [Evansella caseinilytica]SDZ09960.1 Signal transduction histidine kinase [Evansella caseinilytica]